MLTPDLDYLVEQLTMLCNIPSPSGNTFKAIDYLALELQKMGVDFRISNKGALISSLPGKNNFIHRTVAAHVDTLGAMVKEIKVNGRLKLTSIGSFNWNTVEGELCYVQTNEGRIFTGTLLNTHASGHVYDDHGKQERTAETMELRIDEKVNCVKDVKNLGIEVGDFIAFSPSFRLSESGFINSRHLDDKASVAILLSVIRCIKTNSFELPFKVNFIFSNNEEIGYGGNSGITPETKEYLVVDMGAIGDGQTTDEFCVSICAKDSSGPYNYEFRKKLINLAVANNIYYQVDIYPYYGSDAGSALRAGYDIVHGLIGPGIDASHGYERTHKEALSNTAKLLLNYLLNK